MAILASGSKYFLDQFKHFKALPEEKSKDIDMANFYVEVPRPIQTSQNQTGEVSDENVNRILKFIYHNQDFSVIKSQVTALNVSSFYSQAFVMKCSNLLRQLDDMIVNELLSPENCSQFYLDSIRVSTFDYFNFFA